MTKPMTFPLVGSILFRTPAKETFQSAPSTEAREAAGACSCRLADHSARRRPRRERPSSAWASDCALEFCVPPRASSTPAAAAPAATASASAMRSRASPLRPLLGVGAAAEVERRDPGGGSPARAAAGLGPARSRARRRARLRVSRVDAQRLCLPAGAVEREHQLAREPLAQRDASPSATSSSATSAWWRTESELGVDSLFDRRQPQLLEALDLGPRERLVGEIGERSATPERERLAEQPLPPRPSLPSAFARRPCSSRALEPARRRSAPGRPRAHSRPRASRAARPGRATCAAARPGGRG